MSNVLMIDSFGSRKRRNRITASAQREGSAPSFAQRSALLASIVTRCRLSPRGSRTITSKTSPPPLGSEVTDTEGSLISNIQYGRAAACLYRRRHAETKAREKAAGRL